MKSLSPCVALLGVFSFVLVAACSSSTQTSSPSSDAQGTSPSSGPSCDDVCAHVASVCGRTAPTCASACAGWSSGVRSCVNEAACDGIDACASADDGEPSGSGSSTPAPDAGGGASGQCPPKAKGCATRDNDACAPYAKAGYSRALACCGGTDPTQGVGGLDCQGPIVGGAETIWCCK